MNDKTFNILFTEALVQPDLDKFIAEWGTSSLFDPVPDGSPPDYDKVVIQLKHVHYLAHVTVADLRAFAGLTQAAFAEHFCIPKRTLEGWEAKGHLSIVCPPYAGTVGGHYEKAVKTLFSFSDEYSIKQANQKGVLSND